MSRLERFGRSPSGRPGAYSDWARWLLPIAVAALLLSWPAVLGMTKHGGSSVSPGVPVVRPWVLDPPVGQRLTGPFDLVVLVDESGSTHSSDPGGARWVQFEELVRWLARHGRGDRIGVSAFTTTASPMSLSVPSEGFATSRPHVATGDSTDVFPAARVARQAFGTTPPTSRRVVLFITDGASDHVPEALRAVRGADVWVFGLNGDGTWARAHQAWGQGIRSIAIDGDSRSIALAETKLLEDLTGQSVTAHEAPHLGVP